MTFTSLVDLYFITSGIYYAEILAKVFIETGILLVPFVVVFVSEIVSAVEKSDDLGDMAQLLKAFEIKFVMLIVGMFIFFLPVYPVTLDDMQQYGRTCEYSGEPSYINEPLNTGDFFTLDRLGNSEPVAIDDFTLQIADGSGTKTTIALALFIKLGTATSLKAVSMMPCKLDVTAYSEKILQTKLNDPALLNETKAFIRQCYQPALAMGNQNRDQNLPWLSRHRTDEDSFTVEQPWPGHRAFMNGAYYGNVGQGMYSKYLVNGYQTSSNNENVSAWRESKENEENCDGECLHERGGFPTCHEWWMGLHAGETSIGESGGDAISLRARLLNYVPDMHVDGATHARFIDVMSEFTDASNSTITEDLYLKTAFFTPTKLNNIENMETRDYGKLERGQWHEIGQWFTRAAGTLGVLGQAIPEFTGASMIQLAAPMVKAMALFGLILCLPFAALAAYYSFKVLLPIHIVILSILFWPFLWEAAKTVEQSYINAITPDGFQAIIDAGTISIALMMSDAMFLVFPMVLTAVLSAAGIGAGQYMTKPTGSMGGKPGSLGQSGGSKMNSNVGGRAKAAGSGFKAGAKTGGGKGATIGAAKGAVSGKAPEKGKK